MGTKIDYTEVKYNRLTGIEPTDRRKSGSIVWRWRCECGGEAYATGSDVKSGHIKSCGCLNAELIAKRAAEMGRSRRIDYTNKTYNHLTGVKYLYTTSGGNAVWLWKCDCGRFHEADANNVKRNNVTSCGCQTKSRAEQQIESLLTSLKIHFQAQYSFKGLSSKKNNKALLFDYGILDDNDNLLYLIEYDGRQHFYAIDFWGGKEGLLKRHHNDKIKNKWCQELNIPLIRIPYTHKNITDSDLQLHTSHFIYTENNFNEYYYEYLETLKHEE